MKKILIVILVLLLGGFGALVYFASSVEPVVRDIERTIPKDQYLPRT